jgi:hypothetical protein
MSDPIYRLCIAFRYGELGCIWPANDAASVRFPVAPVERHNHLPLTPEARNALRRLHAQSDAHAGAEVHPWSTRERERFELRVRMAIAAVQAQLGAEYEVEYTEQ